MMAKPVCKLCDDEQDLVGCMLAHGNYGGRSESPLDEGTLASLDPGIRDLVVELRRNGFNTTDSGDGSRSESHGGFGSPMVACRCLDAWDLINCAHGLDVFRQHYLNEPDTWRVEASYTPGEPPIVVLFQC